MQTVSSVAGTNEPEDKMKAVIAALCIALVPVEMWGQSLSVSSIIPTTPLIAAPSRPTIGLSPVASSAPKLIAPAITGARPEIPVVALSRPQCNMLVAVPRPDSEVSDSGRSGAIANRAVPIPTQRAACVNAFATPPAADTAAVEKP
ncbi:MAG: hypothetical protein ABI026_08980 [Gemmatimonadaceae bacterium]